THLLQREKDGWRFCAEVPGRRVRLWYWRSRLAFQTAGTRKRGQARRRRPRRGDYRSYSRRTSRFRAARHPPQAPARRPVARLARRRASLRRAPPRWPRARRAALEQMVGRARPARTGRAHQRRGPPTVVSADGEAMRKATAAIGLEGHVSKAVRS